MKILRNQAADIRKIYSADELVGILDILESQNSQNINFCVKAEVYKRFIYFLHAQVEMGQLSASRYRTKSY